MKTQLKRITGTLFSGLLVLSGVPATALAEPHALETSATLAVITGSNSSDGNYDSLKGAFTALATKAEKGTVTLQGDTTVGIEDAINVQSAVTLDLNGHSVEAAGVSGTPTSPVPYLFTISSGGSLTIQGTGTVDVTAFATYASSSSNTAAIIKIAAPATGMAPGTAQIKSGSFVKTVVDRSDVATTLTGLVTLTGGTFDSTAAIAGCDYDADIYKLMTGTDSRITVERRVAEDGQYDPVFEFGGSPYYTIDELKDAFASLSSGTTANLKLLRTSTLITPLVLQAGSVVLDLNGYDLTWSGTSASTGAAITIKGTSSFQVQGSGTVTTSYYDTLVSTESSLTVTEGKLRNTKATGSAVALTGGTLRLSGGALQSAADALKITGGVATVSGGTLLSDTSAAASISAGTLQFAGGSAEAQVGDALVITGGTVRVTGGSVTAPAGIALKVSDTISRPVVEVSASAALTGTTAIESTVSGTSTVPAVSVSGGSITGALRATGVAALVLSGGTYNAAAATNVETFLADNATFDAATGTVTVVSGNVIFDRMVSVTLPPEGYTYDGAAKQPTVSVKRGAETLSQGIDYALSYTNNIDAGVASVAVTGVGSWSGTVARTFLIKAKEVKDPTIIIPETPIYASGVEVDVQPTVKDGTTTLKAGTDYGVTITPNDEGTEATVLVVFKGNYSGSATSTVKLTKGLSVTFVDGIDRSNILAEIAVEKGGSVKEEDVPAVPEHEGYQFVGWSAAHTNITASTRIYATYVRLSSGSVATPIKQTSGDMASGTKVVDAKGDTKTYLIDEDGTASEGWRYVGGSWYYVHGGEAQTGMHEEGNTSYYLGPDGVMRTGWVSGEAGMARFYCFPSGAIAKGGWLWDGSAWYWANDDGSIKIGWHWIGGSWYWLDPNGVIPGRMATGWVWDGSAWYWCDATGAMVRNTLIRDGSLWYCLGPGGDMQYGWRFMGGAWRYFGASGVMYTSTWTPDGYYVGPDGRCVW